MNERLYAPGESYTYPLILKKLLKTPLIYAPETEIVYSDKSRYTYRGLNDRIQCLAGGLDRLGVESGDVVAVLDYDCPRYLECFFAIPMMGAVLQTVNWRLSSEQIVYTINHAEARTIITHADFLPLIEAVHNQLHLLKTLIIINENASQSVLITGPGLKDGDLILATHIPVAIDGLKVIIKNEVEMESE